MRVGARHRGVREDDRGARGRRVRAARSGLADARLERGRAGPAAHPPRGRADADVPELPPVATDALADGIAHVEAAGLLAEAVGDHELTLVVDELERLATSETARSTLSPSSGYAPPTLHVILISRRSMQLHLGSAREVGGVGHITEADSAFSVEEAAHALEALGQAPTTPPPRSRRRAAWVAGVLFEAWRSPDHMHGSGGEADPLSGYLASEIMRNLSDAEQRFLIDTSCSERSARRARRRSGLGRDPAACAPITCGRVLSDGVDALPRAVPRVPPAPPARARRRRRARAAPALRRAVAAEGRHDEALPEFLAARDAERRTGGRAWRSAACSGAATSPSPSGGSRRAAEAIERSQQLTYAELVVAMQSEDGWPERWPPTACARCCRAPPRPEPRGRDRDVLPARQPDGGRGGGRRGLAAGTGARRLGVHPARRDGRQPARTSATARRTATPRSTATSPGSTVAGPLRPAARFEAAPWAGARSSRIAALRAVGRLDEALAMFDEWPSAGRSAAMVQLYAELMADLGRPLDATPPAPQPRADPAQRCAEHDAALPARGDARAAAAPRHRRGDRGAGEGRARPDHTPPAPDARADRAVARARRPARRRRRARRRASPLRRRAAGRDDRLYFLPAAAVYLAEAEWRLGDKRRRTPPPTARCGPPSARARITFAAGAAEFPAVLSRRLDAEAGTDPPGTGSAGR